MAKYLAIFAYGASAESLPHASELWSSYKIKFDKHYANDAEEQKRFGIFSANLDYIEQQNTRDLSYTLGINKFSDLSADEFAAQRLNGGPRPKDLYGAAPFLGNHTVGEQAFATSIDWVEKGAVTHVKNQGQCGSCWTFSATGAMEGAYHMTVGQLVSISEQQIVDCDHGVFPPTMGCSGGSMSAAFNFAKANPMCTEESYPYQAQNGQCHQSNCVKAFANAKVVGYKGLAPVARLIPASMNAMMSALQQQPVSVAIEADKAVFQQYVGGVVTGACGQMPDHGVLVVGYGTDSKYGDYFKIKNSWGADWGEDGYVRIARTTAPLGRGECAVLNSPSYPVFAKDAVVV